MPFKLEIICKRMGEVSAKLEAFMWEIQAGTMLIRNLQPMSSVHEISKRW